MKLELQLSEIKYFIKNFSKHFIKISYVECNKLSVNFLFIADVKITIKEVHKYSVVLNYIPSLAAKLSLPKIIKLLDTYNDILLWDTSKKEICINFSHIDALKELLKTYHISIFEIRDNGFFLELVN
ncbi:hypothetical protein EZS27_003531 [termite gut metagenome]|uniref:Uncharacterized protein n=1 Tax=termite gut metagenome TaxID=433724 RepID=A0A5J4ST61_9ZZZZ